MTITEFVEPQKAGRPQAREGGPGWPFRRNQSTVLRVRLARNLEHSILSGRELHEMYPHRSAVNIVPKRFQKKASNIPRSYLCQGVARSVLAANANSCSVDMALKYVPMSGVSISAARAFKRHHQV